MTRNVGTVDRAVRLIVAAVAVLIAFMIGPGSAGGIVLFVVAAIMLITSLIGTCPIYRLFGMNTCRVPDRG